MKLHLYYCEWKLCVGHLSLYLPGSSGWIRLWIAESGRILGPPESLPLLPPLQHWPWCCTRTRQTNAATWCHRGSFLIHYPTNFVWKPPFSTELVDKTDLQSYTLTFSQFIYPPNSQLWTTDEKQRDYATLKPHTKTFMRPGGGELEPTAN